jgi:hypothetical protein
MTTKTTAKTTRTTQRRLGQDDVEAGKPGRREGGQTGKAWRRLVTPGHAESRPRPRWGASPSARGRRGQVEKGPSSGSRRSGLSSSSTLTSLKVITRTFFTKRAGRYMSHTQASDIRTSK